MPTGGDQVAARNLSAWVALVFVGCAATGCSQSSQQPSTQRPTIVVTHDILASVVREIVGTTATVRTLIPNGKDPHEYAATPRDIEELSNADLIVRNGGGFDQSLDRVIASADGRGVPVFVALDSVSAPPAGVAGDPHFFTDPESMAQVVKPLATIIKSVVGVDVSAGEQTTLDDLAALSKDVARERATLQARGISCVLVTGHESLAYLASRYSCDVVGSVIPGLSTASQASAADLAELKRVVTRENVRAIFVESTMSARVAHELANELRLSVVSLDVEKLGADGSYATYAMSIMSRIVEGLSSR